MKKSYSIKSFKVGKLDNIVHIVFDKITKKAAIFDPAWGSDVFMKFINSNGLILDKIILTHTHHDHTNAITEILKHFNVSVYLDTKELKYHKIPQCKIIEVKDQDIIKLGNTNITAISTPGHSAGGTCYLLSNDLITGDTVFIYGCGHCELPGSDVNELYESLQKLKQLIENQIVLHTSHAYGMVNSTTWDEQTNSNPFLLIDNEDDFIRYRTIIHDKIRTYPMGPVSRDELNKCLGK